MKKKEIMEMKLKDVLGMKVTFKNEITNRVNTGKITAIFRSNALLTMFDIKDAKGKYHHKWLKDIQIIT